MGRAALPPPPASAAERQAEYWRRTRRFTLRLSLAWFALTFGTIFFARELAQISVFGWPLSFYMAAQGATLSYLAIVGWYAWRMRRLDRILQDGGDGK